MEGTNKLVGMGCVCLGLMLTVSTADIRQSYFSWFSGKKYVPEILDSLTSDYILQGNARQAANQTKIILTVGGMNEATPYATIAIEKRSVKRDGVEYFGNITATENCFHGWSKNPMKKERLTHLDKPGRYKRRVEKQRKEASEDRKENKKGIEDEAEYRRLESAARRKEARDQKLKNIKMRREQLKITHLTSRKLNNRGLPGGKKEKTTNKRPIRQKSTVMENGGKHLLSEASRENHHRSSAKTQSYKLEINPANKRRACMKHKCKTSLREKRRKMSKAEQKSSVIKERRKSHPGQGANGSNLNEDEQQESEETNEHKARKKQQHKDDSAQKEKNSKKGKPDDDEKVEKKLSVKKGMTVTKNKSKSSKKVLNNEVMDESEEPYRETSEEIIKEGSKSSKSSAKKSGTSSMKKGEEDIGSGESKSSKSTSSKTEWKKDSASIDKLEQEKSKGQTKTKTSGVKTSKQSESKKKQYETSKKAKETSKKELDDDNAEIESKTKNENSEKKATSEVRKHGNDVEYLSPALGLGLSSRKKSQISRVQSKAQAWSRRVYKRPMTGAYASSGRLTRASSNLQGAYASAGIRL